MFASKKKQVGSLVSFTALILPVLLLIGALILESGNFYIRHTQLENLTRQAANSGLIAFSQILEQSANENKDNLCLVEIPPEICSSLNLFDFLTLSQVQILATNTLNQNAIRNNINDFLVIYDPQQQINSENISIIFPVEEITESVKLKVVIEIIPNQFFSNFLDPLHSIKTIGISYLSLPF